MIKLPQLQTRLYEVNFDYTFITFSLKTGLRVLQEQIDKASKKLRLKLSKIELLTAVANEYRDNGNSPGLRYFILNPKHDEVYDFRLGDKRHLYQATLQLRTKIRQRQTPNIVLYYGPDFYDFTRYFERKVKSNPKMKK